MGQNKHKYVTGLVENWNAREYEATRLFLDMKIYYFYCFSHQY